MTAAQQRRVERAADAVAQSWLRETAAAAAPPPPSPPEMRAWHRPRA